MWPVVGADGHVRTACVMLVGLATTTIWRRFRLAATSCRFDAATASDLVVRVRRLERIVEQIGGVLVPQIMQWDVDGFQRDRFGEQIGVVPVHRIWEPVGEVVQLAPLELVQSRTPEQILDSPVPQIMEAVLPSVPRERVQNRTPEQTTEFNVPQIMEERVQSHTQEQTMDFPVPATPQELVQTRSFVLQITEEIGDGVQHVPSKRMPQRHGDCNIKFLDKYNVPCAGVVSDMIPTGFVRVADVFRPLSHGRTRDVSVRKLIAVKKGPKRVFVDSGSPHSASKPKTGKVFTVEMPHQHVHQAFPGNYMVSNIKDLDKYNALHMEEPVPQIAEEIVERPLPSVHEAVRKFFEQHALEDDLISWETLDASLPPEFLRKLWRRAQELTAFEEEDEEEEEILASS